MATEWIHGKKLSYSDRWKDGIRLVINGGSETLESATVPIEWHFSEALIAERPRYIVIVDYVAPEGAAEDPIEYEFGRRYIVKVTDFAKYLQLYRAGKHKIIFIVCCGDKKNARESAEELLRKSPDGRSYDQGIMHSFVERGWSLDNRANDKLYVTTIDIELPEGLLASRPKTGFGAFIWKWSNHYFNQGPSDECQYRKRKWFALIPTLISFAIGRTLTGIFLTAYSVLLGLLLAFFGFRPVHILMNIRNGWLSLQAFSWSMVASKKWRCLRDEYYDEKTRQREPAIFLPVWLTPIFILAAIATPFVLMRLATQHPNLVHGAIAIVITSAVGILGAFAMIWIASSISSSFLKPFTARATRYFKKQRVALKEKRRLARLLPKKADVRLMSTLQSISLAGAPIPERVDIAKVIKRTALPIKFKLGFWVAKSKVCKPYER